MINEMPFQSTFLEVYHHHWLNFWPSLAGIALLIVVGIGATLMFLPLGLLLLMVALIWAIALYLQWSWHTFGFAPDHRLIRQRGLFGSMQDVISLFGVVTPYQIPILGGWLDEGSVHITTLGSTIQIRHVANFEAFRSRLISSARQEESRLGSPVQVIIQLPPGPQGGVNLPNVITADRMHQP